MMLAVTAICVVLCLSVSVSGDVSLQGEDEPVLFLPQAPRHGVCLGVRRVKGSASASTPIPTWLDARESRRSAAA